ncbi:hypothetical protein L9G74_04320 [Shewanella sp. C32]|uniref:Uncharacterized protein n=1 Tax=Shewanella electrica TaxID=515560 RepID=A0ABT2FH51_9GAMM|nr:hypothetical protein [Shewanella electrica]MCH1923556.1 hypothetical protein [Shewanella electrica]MCS4555652.1 hypothetical protein [Shewanella electrica]
MKSWVSKYQIRERRSRLKRQISNVNWPPVRDNLHLFIEQLLKDNSPALDEISVEKTNGDCGESGFMGFDSLQVTQKDQLTGSGTWIIEENQKKIEYHKEYGVRLDINHSLSGSINVFLNRSKSEMTVRNNPDLLLFNTNDPLDLTDKRVIKFLKTMLFYSEVTSVGRKSSVWDKAKLAFLELRSHIRRKSASSYIYDLVSKSLLSILSLGLAAAAVYIAYLTLLATLG